MHVTWELHWRTEGASGPWEAGYVLTRGRGAPEGGCDGLV